MHTPKEEMEIKKKLHMEVSKIKHFCGHKGKEDICDFSKFFIILRDSQFFTLFDLKKWEFPVSEIIFRISIWYGQNLNLGISEFST